MAEYINDIITGEKIQLVGAEDNRQAAARMLINQKGYVKEDIKRAVPIKVMIGDEPYYSSVDLVVTVNGKSIMIVKCAAGSLGSREREALAAARLLEAYPIPLAVVSDGKTAVVLDTQSGKVVGKGWDAVPDKKDAIKALTVDRLSEMPPDKRRKEALIFRSYDSMNVNR
jgi:hypothetical protein